MRYKPNLAPDYLGFYPTCNKVLSEKRVLVMVNDFSQGEIDRCKDKAEEEMGIFIGNEIKVAHIDDLEHDSDPSQFEVTMTPSLQLPAEQGLKSGGSMVSPVSRQKQPLSSNSFPVENDTNHSSFGDVTIRDFSPFKPSCGLAGDADLKMCPLGQRKPAQQQPKFDRLLYHKKLSQPNQVDQSQKISKFKELVA